MNNATKSSFSNKEGAIITFNIIKVIQDNKAYLSEIDGAIGDGDHGINMNKGFSLAEKRMEGKETDLESSLKILGTILLTEIGGSMGPLYGTFFRSMAKEVKDEVDQEVFGDMLDSAVNALAVLGDAKVGDKTLMDTLIPGVIAYKKACDEGKNFKESLEVLKVAAEEGKNSTYDMVAKVGRAARLGERSKGCLDAGATSCNLIIRTMADSIIEIID